MISAFVKLLIISCGTLFVAVLVVIGLRVMGLQQGFSAPPHPWFEKSFWWIHTPPLTELCQPSGFDDSTTKDWIVQVPIRWLDEGWKVPCPTPVPIFEFIKRTSTVDWILKVEGAGTWGLDQLIQDLRPLDGSKRFAIASTSQKVSVYLRKRAPQWLFAADSASLLRFSMFSSLWLETAFDFWPDFLVANAKDFTLDSRGEKEIQRRQKRIVWDWKDNTGPKPLIKIQGIMTTRPTEARQIFAQPL